MNQYYSPVGRRLSLPYSENVCTAVIGSTVQCPLSCVSRSRYTLIQQRPWHVHLRENITETDVTEDHLHPQIKHDQQNTAQIQKFQLSTLTITMCIHYYVPTFT